MLSCWEYKTTIFYFNELGSGETIGVKMILVFFKKFTNVIYFWPETLL